MVMSHDIAVSPPGPATRAPHGAAADGKCRRRSRVCSRGMPIRHVLLALATVASSEALVPTAGSYFRPPRSAANSLRRAPNGRNDVRLHLKMTDTAPHAASADKRARTASSDRDPGRLGRRSALGVLGVLGAAVMAPQPAQAGFGPGVSTTISPPPVESLNLDQFLNLSEGKRLQRARAGRNQVKRLLGELQMTPSEMRILQQELEEQEELLKKLEKPLMSEFEKMIDEAKNEELYEKLTEKVRVLAKQKEVAASEEEKRLALEKQLKARQDTLDALEAQPAWVSYAAAFAASTFSTLVVHPFDTLKVRTMATEDVTQGGEHIMDDLDPETGPAGHMGESQEGLSFPSNGSLSALMTAGELGMTSGGAGLGVLTAELDVGKGMERRAIEKTLEATAGSHDAGVLSLYDGVLANILKEAPASALYLGVYEWARAIFLQTTIGSNTLLVYLLAGATGEVFASLIRAPSEGIKTRMQANGLPTEAAVAQTFSRAGLASMFRSWQSSVVRDVPFGGIQLMLFEGIKAFILTSPDIDLDVTTLQAEALLGAVGGGIAAYVTTPFDIFTIRIIAASEAEPLTLETGAEGIDGDGELHKGEPVTAATIYNEIMATTGPLGLMQGSISRVLYWAPAIGIFLSTYCYLRQQALHFL